MLLLTLEYSVLTLNRIQETSRLIDGPVLSNDSLVGNECHPFGLFCNYLSVLPLIETLYLFRVYDSHPNH